MAYFQTPGSGAAYSGRNTVMERDGITMRIEGIEEIKQLFKELPKEVNEDTIWGRFWREQTKDLVRLAQEEAPLLGDSQKGGSHDTRRSGRIGIPYPPNKGLTISRGTLRDSIGFFRTKASKGDIHGAYVGPRVKGKYKKNKGGYFGAWVEYGDEVLHFGKYKSKGNKFMHRAWKKGKDGVMRNGMKKAVDIFFKATKEHTKRMKKFGKLGY
tara:strand:+ start:47 stop:682 length:636 start_codon:yes stop_codon:yes gene_type:complete